MAAPARLCQRPRSRGYPARVKHRRRPLPPSRYPFTIRLLDAATRRVVWEARLDQPAQVRIPTEHEVNDGRPVTVQAAWPDGTIDEVTAVS